MFKTTNNNDHFKTNDSKKQINRSQENMLDTKTMQEQMILDYLNIAKEDVEAKKEIHDTKKQRLDIAQCELTYYLNKIEDPISNVENWKESTISLNSNADGMYLNNYNRNAMKSEVYLAKERIQKLKNELKEIEFETNLKVANLSIIDEINRKSMNDIYTLDEALKIVNELKIIHNAITCGEQERKALLESLFQVKDEFIKIKLKESDDFIETSPYGSMNEVNVDSHVNTVAELANMRIEYDELRKKIKIFQASISNINNYYTRTQTESDKDRLLLIKEKEKLLYELKSLNLKTKTTEQIIKIKKMIKETELYLRKVNTISNNDITERLKINQERNTLIEQLKTTTQRMALLEIHLKSVSISTLSTLSSESGRGSLNSVYSQHGSTNSMYHINSPLAYYHSSNLLPLVSNTNRSAIDLIKAKFEENFVKRESQYFDFKNIDEEPIKTSNDKINQFCKVLSDFDFLSLNICCYVNFEISYKEDLNRLEIKFLKINNFNEIKVPPEYHFQVEIYSTDSTSEFKLCDSPLSVIINEINNPLNKTVSIQLDKNKCLNDGIKFFKIFLIFLPNVLNVADHYQDKHVLGYNCFNLEENSEIIFNNPKKNFFQIKLNQIWLNNNIKQENSAKNSGEHFNCLNLCKFCNKRLYNYTNHKKVSQDAENKVNYKLIRSDSDSSIHVNRTISFDRLAKERRSLKYKKNNFKKLPNTSHLIRKLTKSNNYYDSSIKEKHCSIYDKTSIELEFELKMSEMELSELNNELNHLKDVKQKLQSIDFDEKKIIETKANHLYKKSEKKISKLSQKHDRNYLFKEKVEKLTNYKQNKWINEDEHIEIV